MLHPPSLPGLHLASRREHVVGLYWPPVFDGTVLLSVSCALPVLTFRIPVQGASRAWGALDDVVMGGRSESGFELRRGAGEDGGSAGVFSGMVRCSGMTL